MMQQVLSFIKKYHMIERGEHILMGVSGGADSVCLLLVMEELSRQYDCRLTVVHVEHGIRGLESLSDAAFVRALCEEKGIDCRIFHCDAVDFSRERGMSLEEGARELRYHYFAQVQKEVGADKIAVAHNQNDSAETLLFHLARGTGLKGMCGIVPVRGDIIRPLLCVNRRTIEQFLAERGQQYCQDATNQETEYSRNKIRHQVLPVLEEINHQAVAHLYRSTEYVSEALELVEGLVHEAKSRYVKRRQEGEGNSFFILETVCNEPKLVQKMLILEVLGACAEREKDISEVHVTQVIRLYEGQVGKYIMLPYGMEARREYEGIRIKQKFSQGGEENQRCFAQNGGQPLKEPCQQIKAGCKLKIPGYDWYLKAELLEKVGNFDEIPKKTYTKWFDYDKIKGDLLLRSRCQGDYLKVDSLGRTQSLKKYFINAKIPAEEREHIPLVADGKHIVWAVGHRISEAYKITADTKRILKIQINGGSIYE